MVIDSNGDVGIGTSSPSEKLDVSGNAVISGGLTVDTTTLVVDSGGNKVGIGTASPSGQFNVARGGNITDIYLDNYSATSTDRSRLFFRKSSDNTIGTDGATGNGEFLGQLLFQGNTGTNSFADGAQIRVLQSAAAGSSYIPAKIEFKTTNATGTLATAMTIQDNGDLYVVGDIDGGSKKFLNRSSTRFD